MIRYKKHSTKTQDKTGQREDHRPAYPMKFYQQCSTPTTHTETVHSPLGYLPSLSLMDAPWKECRQAYHRPSDASTPPPPGIRKVIQPVITPATMIHKGCHKRSSEDPASEGGGPNLTDGDHKNCLHKH